MILEELEVETLQAGEFRFERAGEIVEALVDSSAKRTKISVLVVGETTAFR